MSYDEIKPMIVSLKFSLNNEKLITMFEARNGNYLSSFIRCQTYSSLNCLMNIEWLWLLSWTFCSVVSSNLISYANEGHWSVFRKNKFEKEKKDELFCFHFWYHIQMQQCICSVMQYISHHLLSEFVKLSQDIFYLWSKSHPLM